MVTWVIAIEHLHPGGAERMALLQANALVEAGHNVHLVQFIAGGALAAQLHPRVRQHTVAKHRRLDIAFAVRLGRLLRHLRADVMLSHLWTANLWLRIAAPAGQLIIVEHSIDPWRTPWHHRINRYLSFRCRHVLAVSEAVATQCRQDVGVPVQVLPNGVHLAPAAAHSRTHWRQKLQASAQHCVWICVARLSTEKRLDRLLQAIAPLRNTHLWVIGDGPERETLQALAERLIPDGQHDSEAHCQIHWFGARHDVQDLLSAADAFVLSSDIEGQPLAAMEAQCAGLPVVLSDVGGAASAMIEHPLNQLAPPDADALRCAMQRLMEQPYRAARAELAPLAQAQFGLAQHMRGLLSLSGH